MVGDGPDLGEARRGWRASAGLAERRAVPRRAGSGRAAAVGRRTCSCCRRRRRASAWRRSRRWRAKCRSSRRASAGCPRSSRTASPASCMRRTISTAWRASAIRLLTDERAPRADGAARPATRPTTAFCDEKIVPMYEAYYDEILGSGTTGGHGRNCRLHVTEPTILPVESAAMTRTSRRRRAARRARRGVRARRCASCRSTKSRGTSRSASRCGTSPTPASS